MRTCQLAVGEGAVVAKRRRQPLNPKIRRASPANSAANRWYTSTACIDKEVTLIRALLVMAT